MDGPASGRYHFLTSLLTFSLHSANIVSVAAAALLDVQLSLFPTYFCDSISFVLYMDQQSNVYYKPAAGIKAASEIYANSDASQEARDHNNGQSHAIACF